MPSKFEVSPGGWVTTEEQFPSGHRCKLLIRFQPNASGRLGIVQLVLERYVDEMGMPVPFDGEALRRLRLGRLEAQANSPAIAAELKAQINHPVNLELREPPEGFFDGMGTAIKVMQTAPHVPPMRPRLNIPNTRPYPDEFFERVAKLYGMLSARSDRPAVDLAEANDVGVERVYGWLKEARKRGLLAPGQKGRS